MTTIYLEISSEVMRAAHMTTEELKRGLAIHLFREGKLSFGKAREMAGLPVWDFHNLLGSRNIPIHYGIEEYESDLVTLKELGRFS